MVSGQVDQNVMWDRFGVYSGSRARQSVNRWGYSIPPGLPPRFEDPQREVMRDAKLLA